MPNYVEFQKSLARELRAEQDRVRHLIGKAHWLSDGEHKEVLLRQALRSKISGDYLVGQGFICYEDHVSTQIDVLITKSHYPNLFESDGLRIVTPDCVAAIIEVKTNQNGSDELQETLSALAKAVSDVREQNLNCWAGLFIYNHCISDELVLSTLHEVSQMNANRVVNFIAMGPRKFIRFWENGLQDAGGIINGPVWHSYDFGDGATHGLSFAYFISNVVITLSPDGYLHSRFAWFPTPQPGNKENYRRKYIALEVKATPEAF